MSPPTFDPPGFLDDLDASERGRWSDWIAAELDKARERDGAADGLERYGPRHQFFNPLRTVPGPGAVEQDITWTAFPRIIQIMSVSDVQRWRKSDSSRDVQDEYCEWSVTHDPHSGKIIRVTFTSEGPEYWEFLAALNSEKTLALYQEHVSPAVKPEHLFDAQGVYRPRNRWNNSTTNGAMHLIQSNNTLGAEIELAAAATIVRQQGGRLLTDPQELIDCGRYGQAERHSDPFIGAQVNALARQKADVTLANPVGLCIAAFTPIGWETPDGSSAMDYWRITRGTKEKALRAVYEVPESRGFVVGDIKINGRPIEFAGQIADFMTIKLTGLAAHIGQSTVAPMDGCVGRAPSPAFAGPITVESALATRRVTRR